MVESAGFSRGKKCKDLLDILNRSGTKLFHLSFVNLQFQFVGKSDRIHSKGTKSSNGKSLASTNSNLGIEMARDPSQKDKRKRV